MKIYLAIIGLLFLFSTEWASAKYIYTEKKAYNFTLKQDEEFTYVYHNTSLVLQKSNEWYSCDMAFTEKEKSSYVLKARICMRKSLIIKNYGSNWYQIEYVGWSYSYRVSSFYNTASKEWFGWSYAPVKQVEKWKNGTYVLSGWEELGWGNHSETLTLLKPNGTVQELYSITDPENKLIKIELLYNKKIKLFFNSIKGAEFTKILPVTIN